MSETEPGGAHEREQKPDGRGQDLRSLFQRLDGAQKLIAVRLEHFDADDGAAGPDVSSRNRGARISRRQLRAWSRCGTPALGGVVVGAAPRGAASEGIIAGGSQSGSPGKAASTISGMSTVLQLRTPLRNVLARSCPEYLRHLTENLKRETLSSGGLTATRSVSRCTHAIRFEWMHARNDAMCKRTALASTRRVPFSATRFRSQFQIRTTRMTMNVG